MYGWHLDMAFKALLEKIPENEKVGQEIEDSEDVEKKIPLYLEEWKKEEQVILGAMCEILGLSFYPKNIEVYICGAHKKAFSNPLVISSKCPVHFFVDLLTHELLHVLLIDNNKKIDVVPIFKEMFPEAIDRTSRNHVLVHAVHKEIYLTILNSPERLARNIEKHKKWKGYEDAWNIVEKRGHANIINEFKTHY